MLTSLRGESMPPNGNLSKFVHRYPASIIIDVLLAAAAAAVGVAVIAPFSFLALAFAFAVVKMMIDARMRDGRRRLAVYGALAAIISFSSVVAAAAAYRPAKVTEQLLDRQVTLPSRQMTLAELAYQITYDRRGFPVRMWIGVPDDDSDQIIQWPSEELTVREFLAALETQANLQHKFAHCGNGYTVLGGGDCSMGLSIFDPARTRDSELFDVDAYASQRDAEEWAISSPSNGPKKLGQ